MRFRTLLADPPWKFKNKSTRAAAEKNYPVMSIEEIKALGPLVQDVSEENAHLYLWTTQSHLEGALRVMADWGFTYKMLIPWIKLTTHGKLHFGIGNSYRPCLEMCLFGVRGKMRTLTRNTRNLLQAKRPPKHSAKPKEMYALIEANSPGPRLELFSRAHREGWTMTGDEINGEDIVDALHRIAGEKFVMEDGTPLECPDCGTPLSPGQVDHECVRKGPKK